MSNPLEALVSAKQSERAVQELDSALAAVEASAKLFENAGNWHAAARLREEARMLRRVRTNIPTQSAEVREESLALVVALTLPMSYRSAAAAFGVTESLEEVARRAVVEHADRLTTMYAHLILAQQAKGEPDVTVTS